MSVHTSQRSLLNFSTSACLLGLAFLVCQYKIFFYLKLFKSVGATWVFVGHSVHRGYSDAKVRQAIVEWLAKPSLTGRGCSRGGTLLPSLPKVRARTRRACEAADAGGYGLGCMSRAASPFPRSPHPLCFVRPACIANKCRKPARTCVTGLRQSQAPGEVEEGRVSGGSGDVWEGIGWDVKVSNLPCLCSSTNHFISATALTFLFSPVQRWKATSRTARRHRPESTPTEPPSINKNLWWASFCVRLLWTGNWLRTTALVKINTLVCFLLSSKTSFLSFNAWFHLIKRTSSDQKKRSWRNSQWKPFLQIHAAWGQK